METGRTFRGMLIPLLPSYKSGNLNLETVQKEEMWKQKFPLNRRVSSAATPVIMKWLPGGVGGKADGMKLLS